MQICRLLHGFWKHSLGNTNLNHRFFDPIRKSCIYRFLEFLGLCRWKVPIIGSDIHAGVTASVRQHRHVRIFVESLHTLVVLVSSLGLLALLLVRYDGTASSSLRSTPHLLSWPSSHMQLQLHTDTWFAHSATQQYIIHTHDAYTHVHIDDTSCHAHMGCIVSHAVVLLRHNPSACHHA